MVGDDDDDDAARTAWTSSPKRTHPPRSRLLFIMRVGTTFGYANARGGVVCVPPIAFSALVTLLQDDKQHHSFPASLAPSRSRPRPSSSDITPGQRQAHHFALPLDVTGIGCLSTISTCRFASTLMRSYPHLCSRSPCKGSSSSLQRCFRLPLCLQLAFSFTLPHPLIHLHTTALL